MRHYIALLHKEPKSDYGVSFPDLPGCVTGGKTLDEARQKRKKRLRFISPAWRKMASPHPNRRLWKAS